MCTVVILRRPDHRWPILLAANRDEMLDRPWRPPARHWPDRPEVTAGLDELAGGSWLGLNDHGVVAGILNRMGSLGPAPGQRTRGELVLEALDNADAVAAAQALSALDPAAYRPFNMVVADNRDAYWLCNRGAAPPDGATNRSNGATNKANGATNKPNGAPNKSDGAPNKPNGAPNKPNDRIEIQELPPGVSMVTAHDLNDTASERIQLHLPLFRDAPEPEPEIGDWRAWETILASRRGGANRGRESALAIVGDQGFGTVSGSLIALPAIGADDAHPIWRFSAGVPGDMPFVDVAL
jgi:hypothetical protein